MNWIKAFLYWVATVPVWVAGMLLGFLVVPIALLFVQGTEHFVKSTPNPRTRYRLPRWAYLWDNEDDGLEGPDKRVPERIRGKTYIRRLYWLAYRNPFHNGSSEWLGFHALNAELLFDKTWGDPSDWAHTSGVRLALCRVRGEAWPGYAFLLKIVWAYPWTDHSFEWSIGWKLWEAVKYDKKDPWVNTLVRLPHPWRGEKE